LNRMKRTTAAPVPTSVLRRAQHDPIMRRSGAEIDGMSFSGAIGSLRCCRQRCIRNTSLNDSLWRLRSLT
jgi:hypothetical protein